ncbi:hypothetical protein F4813DRAFT_357556 [Daldinia decipiens]|uniref:uncharacterized protein n=1 Tax=Daldinia decipiens TaxID=326647 RepID=UPI0020C2B63A|nr:uncharacterized protein F4813DRAFT_357556 [Daldinia decipiens]KAI1658154.1 hypothetical protein F4813DRAFT_357556 [Daldinia decipiens]
MAPQTKQESPLYPVKEILSLHSSHPFLCTNCYTNLLELSESPECILSQSQSKKRQRSNSPDTDCRKKTRLSPPLRSDSEAQKGHKETQPISTLPFIRSPTVEEFKFRYFRENPKIAAWLGIDDPDLPEMAGSYRTTKTVDSIPIILSTTASSMTKKVPAYLIDANFRSAVLRDNKIEFLDLDPHATLPDWVQTHINEVNSVEGDDIPIDICNIHADYVGTAMRAVYESEILHSLITALGLGRRVWFDDSPLLKYHSQQVFQYALLPPEVGTSTLHNPRPDILFGYNNEYIPALRAYDIGYKAFRSAIGDTVCLPYLIMESQGHLGHILVAENQSFISGRISLDMTWPILGDQDIVFVVGTMPYLAHLYVMWRDVVENHGPRYYIKLISVFSLIDLEQFKRFRTAIFHIQYWAKNNRLKRVLTGLEAWRAAGCPRHKYQPSRRSPMQEE